jgi:hypothetical protein
LIFDEPPGSYDICTICFWGDDLSQLRFPKTGGANHVSLIKGQKNFAEFGACEERFLKSVRPVSNSDIRDEEWRPIDLTSDNIEEPVSGFAYGQTYPEDYTHLYYWRSIYWRHK